ncbi:MAG: hypothetical protein NW237_14515 [Cyanobacteriota bacterium]|nr:hypothetical protein [Cyanobacteriota bacterium]
MVVRQTSLPSLRSRFSPGTAVEVLYPPYAQGSVGVIAARENAERWLVSIPSNDLNQEPLLLSLHELELQLAS